MPMPNPSFQIAALVPNELNREPEHYYVIETYWTSDGPRTRIIGVRQSYEEAAREVSKRNSRLLS